MTTWREDLNWGLAAFGLRVPERVRLEDLLAKLDESPSKGIAQVVATASALFFLAERSHNPKVSSVFDASVYCSGCLNVGDTGIHPVTPIGKLVGTLLMTYGQALAQRSLDRPAHAASALPSGDDTQQQILVTLREILASLNTAVPAPEPRANGS